MNMAFQQIIQEIRGSDIHKARAATVRATLVLERDTRGYWDRSVIGGFPQSGLYDQEFTDEDILAFIRELAACSQDVSIAQELRQSAISALCTSNRPEVFSRFVEWLRRTANFKVLCETTDVLFTVAFFRNDENFLRQRADELREIIDRPKNVEFEDETAMIAKERMIAALS